MGNLLEVDETPFAEFVRSHSGRFSAIAADPPWAYRFSTRQSDAGNNGWHGGADRHYPLMSVEQVAALPVGDLAAEHCVLFLWVVNAMMPECLDVVRQWGFQYKNLMTWGKVTASRKPAFGTGYWLRGATEHAAVAIRGRPQPTSRSERSLVLTDWDGELESLILAETGTHSTKPVEAIEAMENLTIGAERVELFARRPRTGWTCWGRNAPGTDPNYPMPAQLQTRQEGLF